jgi:hypothetical protein
MPGLYGKEIKGYFRFITAYQAPPVNKKTTTMAIIFANSVSYCLFRARNPPARHTTRILLPKLLQS